MRCLFSVILYLTIVSLTLAEEEITSSGEGEESFKETKQKMVYFDLGLDPYYSSVGIIFSFKREEIPTITDSQELALYRKLFQASLVPRFLLLEASVNPMPIAGVAIRRYAADLYQQANLDASFNLVKAITAGFEEPYAASLFLGNLAKFKHPEEKATASNMGYMGYLISVGNYHIKDNQLIEDLWTEIEWKIKGERIFEQTKHDWSFRVGGKFHSNPEIADVFYISLRRNYIDFLISRWKFFENSGIEYRFDFDAQIFAWRRLFLLLEKKFPLKKPYVFTLAIGFNYEAIEKYTGSLADRKERENFQFLIRPNILF